MATKNKQKQEEIDKALLLGYSYEDIFQTQHDEEKEEARKAFEDKQKKHTKIKNDKEAE